MLLLAMPVAQALEWEDYCIHGNLISEAVLSSCKTDVLGTTCNYYTINQTTNCPYGCDNVTKSCMPPKYETNMILILAFLVAIGVCAYIVKKLW